MRITKKCCCSGDSDCCAPDKQGNRKLVIDFLYLDLSVCTRCQGTEAVLEEAVADVAHVLKAAGLDVVVNKVNVNSKELAVKHRFVSSPTIRMNGRDIEADVRESLCESCGDLCCDTVDCRVWTFQGVEYTVPPKELIVNAMLREVYGSQAPVQEQEYVLPPNLEHFYDAMASNKGDS